MVLSYELGGAVGVTTFGSIFAAIYMRAFVPPWGIVKTGNAGNGIDQARAQTATLPADQAAALGTATQTAFETAFVWVLITAVAVSLLGAALVARRMPGRL